MSQQFLFNQSVRSQTTLELADIGQSAGHHMTLSVGQSAFESVDQSVNHHMLVNQ